MRGVRAGTGRWSRVATLLAVLLLLVVGTACWPEEGYDAARSGFNPIESAVTAANAGGLVRAWGTDTGATAGTPIVIGSRVFVGAGDAVEAFDTASGTNDWVTHNDDAPAIGPGEVGPLTASGANVVAPVNWGGDFAGLFTFDDVTGARSGSANVHFRLFGSLAERSDATADVSSSFAPGVPPFTFLSYGTYSTLLGTTGPTVTSPSLVGRSALVGVDSSLASYSLDTCVQDPQIPPNIESCLPKWSTDLLALPSDPVGIGTTEVAVGLANGDVAVLDLSTGAVLWTAHTGSTAATAPAVANGQLFVGAADGRLYAFSASGCGQAVCAPEWSAPTAPGASVSDQPAVAANVVYVGTSTGVVDAFAAAGCGTASCVSLWSGAVNASGPAAPVFGPVVSDGTVYASAGSTLAAFRLPG